MKFKKETILGAVFLITIVIVVYGVFYLKGIDLLKQRKYLYAIYESTHGLTPDNIVVMKGVQIGKVTEIKLTGGTNPAVLVKLVVQDKNVRITKDATCSIISLDILGTRAIEIKNGTSPEEAQNGDTLNSIVEKEMKDIIKEELKPLKGRAEELLASLDSTIQTLNVILSPAFRVNLTSSIYNLNEVLKNTRNMTARIDEVVTSTQPSIQEFINNLNTTSRTLRQHTGALVKTINNLAVLSDTLKSVNWGEISRRLDSLLSNLAYITDKLKRKEGNLGMLINDTTLYMNLLSATASLDSLLKDLKKNPHRYVSFSLISVGGKK